MSERIIERRALKIMQSAETPLFLFALAAEEIEQIADVARISRDELGKLLGYQRPEKKNHVKQILDYLDSGDVLFPNGLILALPPSVHFKSSRGPGTNDGLATAGTLEIPLAVGDGPRPAWIVDGQQRSIALSRTKNKRLAVPVAGFIAEGIEIQRDQFLRVNTVSPLPTALVNELLPEVSAAPSNRLSARKLPSALVDMLNQDPASPFHGLIKRASTEQTQRRATVVTDTSLLEALRESIESPSGSLFPFRNLATNTTDTEGIRSLLIAYWTGVAETFPSAWGLPPTRSRLMHGVGIRSMSRLMERVMINLDPTDPQVVAHVRAELRLISDDCHWTSGVWPEINIPWNELQNTPRHISTLSNYLVRTYVQARGSKR